MVKVSFPPWQPREEDYLQIFREQNPWYKEGRVPETLAPPVPRSLAKSLWKRLKHNEPSRFQVVLGPRRVGKSTAMYQTVQRLLDDGVGVQRLVWLRMDHPLLMQLDLGALLRMWLPEMAKVTPQKPIYVFLDEVTYAKKWDVWLKTFFDERWPICLVGSSSATAALRQGRLESGVGRWEEQYLAPYLLHEFLELHGQGVTIPIAETLSETLEASLDQMPALTAVAAQRRRYLLTGGFPELLMLQQPTDEAGMLLHSQRTLRSDAVERAIYKDIPQTFGVGDPMLLERVLYTLAGQFTGILSPSSICQNLGGLTQPTLDRYLSYLERAFLVFTLTNYSGREATRQMRGRKLYFVDGAVRNAALQRGLGPLSDQQEMGLLLENLVAGHLHALSQQSQVRLHYWRDGNDEVDFVYDHPTAPLAFEIGSSMSHSRKGLQALIKRFPRFQQRCYIVTPDAMIVRPSSRPDGIGMLPLDLLLLVLGMQAEKDLTQRLAPSP